MIDDDLSLGAKRFRLLLKQLKSEHGSGWQTEYAKKMGLKQPHLSDMLAGKNVTLLSIEKAVRSLGIARDYFFDRSLGDSPNYRDFVGKRFASASIRATTSASATATTRYEPEPRDEEGLSVWDRFLFSDASERASAEAIAYYKNHLDEVSGRDGLTVELIAAAVRAFDAGRRSRAVEEPEVHSEIRPGRFARQPVKKTK